jgi:hypothetical protein
MKSFKAFLLENMSLNQAMSIFNLSGEFSSEKLKTAYRAISRKLHPDAGGSVEAMQQANAAHDLLKKHVGGSAVSTGKPLPTKEYIDMMKKKAFLIIDEHFKKMFSQNAYKSHLEFYAKTDLVCEIKTTVRPISVEYLVTFSSADRETHIEVFFIFDLLFNRKSGSLGTDDLLPSNALIGNSILHNRKKIKMKQVEYEWSQSNKIMSDATIMFPKAKMKKRFTTVVEGPYAKVKPASFFLTLKTKFKNAVKYDSKTIVIPLGTEHKLLIARCTMNRMGYWMFTLINTKTGIRIHEFPTALVFEYKEGLDLIIEEVQALLKGKNERELIQIGKKYEKVLTASVKNWDKSLK